MQNRPNIIFILADDMGPGDIAALNNGRSHTPAINSLMSEGMYLSQHYSSSPICMPARSTLMTGHYPQRVGCVALPHHNPWCFCDPDVSTIADQLKAGGYHTGIVGKWHLGKGPRLSPNQRGFDESTCFYAGLSDYYNWRLEYNDVPCKSDGRYITDVITDGAIDFIERNKKEPFFLHLAYNAPHTPLQAPEEDIKFFTDKGLPRTLSTIYAMIRCMDRGIGRVLETLEKNQLAKNTIVFFTTDNGPAHGGIGFGSDYVRETRLNCDMRGCKGNVYEGGIRVPMIIRWPEKIAKGVMNNKMIHFADWFPTILAMAGLSVQGNERDGINVLNSLQGMDCPIINRRFWEWSWGPEPLAQNNQAMRDGDWKLVYPTRDFSIAQIKYRPKTWEADLIKSEFEDNGDSGRVRMEIQHGIFGVSGLKNLGDDPQWSAVSQVQTVGAKPELYNLANDHSEERNCADDFPDRVQSMQSALDTWFEEMKTYWERFRKVYPYGHNTVFINGVEYVIKD
ncbi:MAG: sulfatase-like hydrolase/transferase [Candidatus Humimicrobiaceae bacterium]